jgi:hypothetical protein
MKALIAGWFSFHQMGATAGDLFSRDVVARWLEELKIPFDIALAPPFTGGVDVDQVDPTQYTHLIFVCGPFGRSWKVTTFLERFRTAQLIGVNLTMIEPLSDWNPFALLLERDSLRTARPDLAFLSQNVTVPIVGVVLIDTQPEYGDSAKHVTANDAINLFVSSTPMAPVRIDTRLDINATGLKSGPEIESLIARMDVVLTSRMHGLVLSIKNGVPVVAVDPVAGGAKVMRQAMTIGWPCVLSSDTVTQAAIAEAYQYCLSAEARAKAADCARRAREVLTEAEASFKHTMGTPVRRDS